MQLRRYRLPLAAPPSGRGGAPGAREGIIATLFDEAGNAGSGEAAPAWWAGGEALAVAASALGEAAEAIAKEPLELELLDRALAPGGAAATGAAGRTAAALERSPAALCAVETAVLDLGARVRGESVTRALCGRDPRPCAIAALLAGEGAEALEARARSLLAAGYEVLKLKVGGRPSWHEDLARVRRLRELGDARMRLRLDANRAWDGETARAFLAAVGDRDIDFVEEPLAVGDAADLATLRAETTARLAVDESLVGGADLERFIAEAACDVVVLKLARVGGPRRALALATRATAAGLRVVFTDSIETEVGRAATLQTAASLDVTEPVGLGGSALSEVGGTCDGGPEAAGLEPAILPRGPGLGCAVAIGPAIP